MVDGGSFFDADYPRKWVIFARRFTPWDRRKKSKAGASQRRQRDLEAEIDRSLDELAEVAEQTVKNGRAKSL